MAIKRLLLVLPLTVLVGCNAHQQAMSANMPHASYGQPASYGNYGQAQYQQPYSQNTQKNFNTQAFSQQQPQKATPPSYDQNLAAFEAKLEAKTEQKIAAMGERVRRVERAMIRLDRRMQVLERNELVKVSGLQQGLNTQAPVGPFAGGQFRPTSYPSPQSNVGPNAGLSTGYAAQYTAAQPFSHGASILSRTPFAARGKVNTQELNSKHVSIAPLQPAQPYAQSTAAAPRLASLADSHTQNDADAQVAIWTVNYDARKIWPDRAELASSTEVVNALRSGRPVNVFARGARPSSKEFRERVRALSRYLGRVANLGNVPISAMPADHLGTDTIELLVAN